MAKGIQEVWAFRPADTGLRNLWGKYDCLTVRDFCDAYWPTYTKRSHKLNVAKVWLLNWVMKLHEPRK